jgi:phytoene/squalene synthetase
VPATPEEAERRSAELAGAFAEALLGRPAGEEAAAFGAALLRLHALQHLAVALAGNRWPLARTELPSTDAEPARLSPAGILAAVGRERERLRPALLRGGRALAAVEPAHRRAAAYALLAALRLLDRLEDAGASLLTRPPRLGAATRVWLLLRARWGKPR